MGIETVLESSDGVRIASVEDPTNILHRTLPSHDDKRYQCLNRIDWYGDTIFNRHQVPTFRSELRDVIEALKDPEQIALLNRIGILAERCDAEPHLYLKFYGD